MFTIGSNVLNPHDRGVTICTIAWFSGHGRLKRAILAPYTSRGYPSINNKKWIGVSVNKLHQAKKYPKLQVCPECKPPNVLSDEEQLTWRVLNTPLRWSNINDTQRQCKKCKKWFYENEK